jgi:hypothetical protein
MGAWTSEGILGKPWWRKTYCACAGDSEEGDGKKGPHDDALRPLKCFVAQSVDAAECWAKGLSVGSRLLQMLNRGRKQAETQTDRGRLR